MSDKKNINSSHREEYLNRLKTLIDEIGGIKAFSDKTEVPYQTVRQYLKNSEPTRPVLVKICEKLDISLVWLLQGKHAIDLSCDKESTHFRETLNNSITSEIERTRVANTAQINIHRMDEIMDDSEPSLSEAIRLSDALKNKAPLLLNNLIDGQIHIIPEFDSVAYNKFMIENNDVRKSGTHLFKRGAVGIRRDEIQRKFKCNPEQLVYHEMHDYSMHPEAPIGSRLFIDMGTQSIQHDKLFLFRIDGQPYVRSAIKLKNGGWDLVARDKCTTPITLASERPSESFSTIGKVVGIEKSI